MFHACVQGLGLDKCVEEAKARMARYSVTPNMLICPPQLLLYMATAPEEKITYAPSIRTLYTHLPHLVTLLTMLRI